MQALHSAICAAGLMGCAVITDADEAARKDADDDGIHWTEDCDDEDPDVGVEPVWYQDFDGDSFGSAVSLMSCEAPLEGVLSSGDCDDQDASVHPGADELCNSIDDDCDGQVDEHCDESEDGR